MSRLRPAVAALPVTLTLGNLVCGFLSIALVAEGIDSPERLYWAAWLVFLAMVFDALDGKVARLTGSSSTFGGELDSLADMVTFGLAPALIVSRILAGAGMPPVLAWGVPAIYVCCAGLRLARFNAANTPDESSHRSFIGLPSPAAAAAIASLVLLMVTHGANAPWMAAALPFWTVALGVLMVSTVRYPHAGHLLLRRHRKPAELVPLALAVVGLAALREVGLAVACQLFAASGVIALLRRPVSVISLRYRAYREAS